MGKHSRAHGLLQALEVLAVAVNAVVLVGGCAGIQRGHQGGGVPAGEQLGVGRRGDPPRSFAPLPPFAFLFLPLLRTEVNIQRT